MDTVSSPCPERVCLGQAASPQPGWLVPSCVHSQSCAGAELAGSGSVAGGWLSLPVGVLFSGGTKPRAAARDQVTSLVSGPLWASPCLSE